MADAIDGYGTRIAQVIAVAGLAMLVCLGIGATSAVAEPIGARVKTFVTEPSSSQAGGHPDAFIEFEIGSRIDPISPGGPGTSAPGTNQVKDAIVELPAGFIGNVHAVTECSQVRFVQDECSADSQVGLAKPSVLIAEGAFDSIDRAPLYSLAPAPGQAGLLAFKAPIFGFPIYITVNARTGGDYGLTAGAHSIGAFFGLWKFKQWLWGVPASPVHDGDRAFKGGNFPNYGASSGLPEKPFLTMPTTCAGPLTSTLNTLAYDAGVRRGTAPWPATTGCDQLTFNPSLSAKPSTDQADSATGLDIALKVPQVESPKTPSSSEIKAVHTRLPAGFSVNPSSADGKTSCSNAQALVGSEDEEQCPQESKVGTTLLDTWALPDPIEGSIYLGEPLPGDRYRLIFTADGFGTHIKLLGSAKLNRQSGQIETVFDNLPQAPFTEFDLHFFGSERALLASPSKCGTYAVETEFEPWARELPNQTSTQFFTIDRGPNGQPCPSDPPPFKPGFRAAGQSNGAGAHSPFSINITRADGEQTLSTIGVNTPPGFSATLKGIPYCPDATIKAIEDPSYLGRAEYANSKCPSASQVGYSSAGAGAGSRPYYAPGRVYLTGPYKGAPLSFTVITPAVSGPYDLGNVVNRVAVNVDPTTAQVNAVSDPLPQLIEGIPLRLKSVLINLDRKDFTLNPTNCNPFEITGVLTGNQGAKSEPQSHFQVANCGTLDFAPKLKTTLTGSTKRGGHPALTATLTQDPDGESNVARAVVSLPHSEFLAQAHIRTICTRVQFAADACPAASVYGTAKAITPLLDDPVSGPVYLRASSNPLPDLVAALKGPARQPIEVNLVGKIDSVNGGIRTTFATVPDTPVSKFTLSMQGGKKGLLENSRNLCRSTSRVDAKLTGQSGAKADQRPVLEAPCAKGRKKATAKKRAAADKSRRAGR